VPFGARFVVVTAFVFPAHAGASEKRVYTVSFGVERVWPGNSDLVKIRPPHDSSSSTFRRDVRDNRLNLWRADLG
jgi:hypothetical protein